MSKIAQIVVILSYLAGVGFGLAAILKFRAHKDNPTQIAITVVVVLLYLAVSFVGLFVLLKRIQLSVIPPQSNEYD
jgi:intracellular multiplication protein IcmD